MKERKDALMRLEKRGHGGVFATDTGRMLGTVCQEMIADEEKWHVRHIASEAPVSAGCRHQRQRDILIHR